MGKKAWKECASNDTDAAENDTGAWEEVYDIDKALADPAAKLDGRKTRMILSDSPTTLPGVLKRELEKVKNFL